MKSFVTLEQKSLICSGYERYTKRSDHLSYEKLTKTRGGCVYQRPNKERDKAALHREYLANSISESTRSYFEYQECECEEDL